MRHCLVSLAEPPRVSGMGVPRHGEFSLIDDYYLPEHWCFHIYGYCGTLELDGVPFAISPGSASIIPPGTRIIYRYAGTSEHVYMHFQPTQEAIPVKLPVVFHLGTDYESFDDRARKAVERSALDDTFARATLWSLLLEIAEREQLSQSNAETTLPATVEVAIKHIEKCMYRATSVDQLGREVGVSGEYLSRLFKKHLGRSVWDYVRQRRADHAEHLLKSTTLPIQVIARAVGVPDLQQFSRLMKQMKGESPRKLRARP